MIQVQSTLIVGGRDSLPIFEYLCRDCGFKVERVEFTPDWTLPICPRDGLEMEKQISVPSEPQFKGSGWTTRGPGK